MTTLHTAPAPATHGLGRFNPSPGRRTLVIAEAGVNHDGDVNRALRLIDAAVEAGADIVKFQMFRAAELATARARTAAYQQSHAGTGSQRDMLARLELGDADFARLIEHCATRGIEFLATPFSTHDVARLMALGARGLKIASTDLNNRQLLAAAADTQLPLIVSTGASQPKEIDTLVAWLRSWDALARTVLLHCVSAYPTPLAATNLRAVGTLHAQTGLPVGFSDHTTSVLTGSWAVAAGACVLEKHLTLDRDAAGPDHALSLLPAELAEYIGHVRQAELALGTGRLGYHPVEEDVRRVARKSVVAACDIPAGATITADMLTAKRPGDGIPADRVTDVVGRCTRAAIAADTPLAWDDLA